jgi:hypothetical protein
MPFILGPWSAIGSDKPSKSSYDNDDDNDETYKGIVKVVAKDG